MNEAQQNVFNNLHEFAVDPTHSSFYLFGYAGSGKTYIISRFVKEIYNNFLFDTIFICAPTHVSLQVLESNMQDIDSEFVKFFTIHRVLGYKQSINIEDGSVYFSQKNRPKISPKSLIILDECSMINIDMAEKIKNTLKCKKIFLGDIKQLPPVGEKITEIYNYSLNNTPDKYRHLLETIVRAKSDTLKNVNLLIRNWDGKKEIMVELSKMRDGKSFKIFHNSKLKTSNWFINYINDYEDECTSIVLTWTNNQARFYNTMIREFILKEHYTNNFTKNDIIVFNNFYKPFYKNEEDKFIQFKKNLYTSNVCKITELATKKEKIIDWKSYKYNYTVEDIELKFNTFVDKLDNHFCEMDIFEMTVHKINDDVIMENLIIFTISRDYEEQYKEYLTLISAEINLFNRSHEYKKIHERLWSIYHDDLVGKYANIGFGYSITVHKSQGGTYDSVYVDFENIMKNTNYCERSKCMYTASSRASKELFLLV